jgi:hypothetical protein
VCVSGVNEGIVLDHVLAHVVCPFEDLRQDIDKKSIR